MSGCVPTHKELIASMLSVYQFGEDALLVRHSLLFQVEPCDGRNYCGSTMMISDHN